MYRRVGIVKAEQNYMESIIIKKKKSFHSGGRGCLTFYFLKPKSDIRHWVVLVPIIDCQNQKCQYPIGTWKRGNHFKSH